LADIKALRREFRDRFGKIPCEVEILLQCAEVRIQAGDAHVPIRVIVKWSDFTPLTSGPATDSPAATKPSDNKGTP